MNGIVFDVGGPLLANGAFLGIGRIGGAHQLAQVGYSVFLFQSQSYDRAAGHEGSERVVKRLAGMHRVKLFSLVFRNFQHLQAKDLETLFFELFNDVADAFFANCVGFYDGESPLQSFHSSVVNP